MKTSVIVFLLVATIAASCEKETSAQFQGHWNLVRIVIGGQSYDYSGIMEFNDDLTFEIKTATGSLVNSGQYTLENEKVLTFYYDDPTHQPVEIYDIITLTSSTLIMVDREYQDRYELERR